MDKSRLDDGTVLVGFELPAGLAATSVSLVGDFNGWSPGANQLTLLDDGRFRTELPLPAGHRWRFRYVLDGHRWENDWAADDYVPNGLGAYDSVVDLTDVQRLPLATPAATRLDEAADDAGADDTQVDDDARMDDDGGRVDDDGGRVDDDGGRVDDDGGRVDDDGGRVDDDRGRQGEAEGDPARRHWWQFWGRRKLTTV